MYRKNKGYTENDAEINQGHVRHVSLVDFGINCGDIR